MKIELTIKKLVDVKYISFDIPIYIGDVEYSDNDSTFGNFIEDNERLFINVDLETGIIPLWNVNGLTNTFRIYSKVQDGGKYTLYDENFNEVASYDGYVPEIFSCIDKGYGDYISMDIAPDGKINNWDPNKINDFIEYLEEGI
jgi:hypothetical protein